ncbi:TPA: hypothetical protein L9A40_002314 [Klebsiella pneumoniae]|jgi:uncharacterized protein (TIGR02646 family)|uniref:HNH endonuclease n=1 Tax=Klebsiella pneumoniae TaxID=573 RepID=UPI000907740A|nr:hypothetical protein [Klebsiella pneumoniae]HBQ5991317.1 hypothetical protein [Klebsiella pneumoniae subsp. pneumoniae]MBC4362943.1 hypothetical protein [Klebsiella pneumoniae]MBX9234227.1 hypothetical protein [Klebsiella pneumoniae]MDR4847953.1 hypothetical protein [Klebsiella pneumoniae]MDX8138955.1 hypothetical protein [Klebsiella pneumoniae]
MINRITATIYIPPFIKNKINSFKPFSGGDWDKKDKSISIFKRLVRKQLLSAQRDCCAYCGLPLDETGKTEIEHLAPKGGPVRPKHVEFMFEVENLYLSCNLCNSPVKKGVQDTIVDKDSNDYSRCTFSIVHPRYDIPEQHYLWTVDIEKVLIQGNSDKGRESIRIFKLDSGAHTEARARIELHKRYKRVIDPNQKALIKAILGYQ